MAKSEKLSHNVSYLIMRHWYALSIRWLINCDCLWKGMLVTSYKWSGQIYYLLMRHFSGFCTGVRKIIEIILFLTKLLQTNMWHCYFWNAVYYIDGNQRWYTKYFLDEIRVVWDLHTSLLLLYCYEAFLTSSVDKQRQPIQVISKLLLD